MSAPDDRDKASRLEQGLLLAALLFYGLALPLCSSLFRPGYAVYDEETTLDKVQAWREGAPLLFRFAWASLYHNLEILLCALAGPHLSLMRLPALAGVLAEALLLYVWLRDKLGERAALWACLADLLCTATFARGGSLTGGCLLPALFLAHAVCCERVRRPWQAALWSLSAALCLLDYEAWTGALLFLAPYAAWRWRRVPGLLPAGALGAAAGAGLVLRLTPDLASHVLSRGAASLPARGFLRTAWTNALDLAGQGERMPFSAADRHPWPAPWTWPLILTGAWAALRRLPWLALLLGAGSLALGLAGTSTEPHRMSLALLALAAFGGAGAALLWSRPWGRALCLALLLFGAVDEARAWIREPAAKLDAAYGNSLALEQAADWLAANPDPRGWDVISGLGPYADGAFRFLLDQDGVRKGSAPVALVYWDYRPGLSGLQGPVRALAFGAYRPVLLCFPSPADAERLRAVRAELAPLRRAQLSEPQAVQTALAAAWLRDPAHKDPWARTVAWELWLLDGLLYHGVNAAGARRLLAEPLVSGWAPDVLAGETAAADPALSLLCRRKAEAVDPRRAAMSPADRMSRY
jgi:hypothetical protein